MRKLTNNSRYWIKTFSIPTFVILFWLIFLGVANAGTLVLESDNTSVAPEQEILVTALIDTDGEKINAISATLVFNHEEVELLEIWSGNSIIPIWVDSPELDLQSKSTINFAGIIPGGYKGHNGNIFSLVFNPLIDDGETIFNVGNLVVVAHSVDGRQIQSRGQNVTVSVSEAKGALNTVPRRDNTPPEDFRPTIARGQDLFENNHFIIFNTEDHESGVSYYEILETTEKLDPEDLDNPRLPWRFSSSPAELSDQTLKSYIYVRAHDNVGNIKLSTVEPAQKRVAANRWYLLHILIGLITITLVIYFARRIRKRRKKSPNEITKDSSTRRHFI